MKQSTAKRCKLIGGKIAGYRITRGLTQDELAARIHISRITLNRIERFTNLKDLSIGTIVEIAEGLEINPQLLLDMNEEEEQYFMTEHRLGE